MWSDSDLEAIQRRAWMTASTSIVKLEVALSSWTVVAPCLTVNPYPVESSVTEVLRFAVSVSK